jgi:hypothetical protein
LLCDFALTDPVSHHHFVLDATHACNAHACGDHGTSIDAGMCECLCNRNIEFAQRSVRGMCVKVATPAPTVCNQSPGARISQNGYRFGRTAVDSENERDILV